MKKFLFYLLLFALIFIFVFRNLIINIKTNLVSTGDYLFIIWQMHQNINKILKLEFANFFETNAFYPNKLTLLFSDILLPQSIIALLISLIIKNKILIFNILFFITFLLNYLSLLLFWKKLFKNNLIVFLGTIFFIFSPYFHLQLGHFQMLSYWPLFFSLYFLLKNDKKPTLKNIFFTSFFLAIQFLASVYLAFFLSFTIFIFYLINILFFKQKKRYFKEILLIFLIFLILDGVFIKGYISVKSTYKIKKDIKEYILFSAHLSDYLFTSNINSLLNKSFFLNKWNSLDKHIIGEKSSFPGVLFFTLFLLGLFSINLNKSGINISVNLNKINLFFLILLLCGFWFSLGPEINFNGNYAHIPTSYGLILKIFPLIQFARALARWNFLFYLSIIYFSLCGLQKLLKKNNKLDYLTITFITFMFVIEYIPLNLNSYRIKGIAFQNKSTFILKKYCKNNENVLMEIPVTHSDVKGGIINGINYISSVLLNSLEHKCYLINGYSGVDLQSIFSLRDMMYDAINKRDLDKFSALLKTKKINFVKINKEYLLPEVESDYNNFVKTFLDNNYINNLKLKKFENYDLIIID